MEILQDDYDGVVALLRSGDRGAAFKRLRDLVEGDNSTVFALLDQIADQAGIGAEDAVPQAAGPAPPAGFAGAPVTRMRAPSATPEPQFTSARVADDGGPNFPTGRVVRFLAFTAFCVGAFFIGRALIGGGGEKSPFFSERGAATTSPPAFLSKTDEGGQAPAPKTASKNLRFDLGVEETHIIAIGFHESAGMRTNVAHFEPISLKPLSYPIEYDGERWRYERILADDEPQIEFDTDASGRVVALKDEDASRFQNRRLFRVLLASTSSSRLENAWLVDRETNRVVSVMPKGDDVVRGSGVTKVDFFLRNWHTAEWDLYCDFSTYDATKPRDQRRSTTPIRVRFELPRYDMFDVSDGEQNLFEVEVPFYRPVASMEKAGYGMTSQAQYYKEGKVPLGRVLEDVAQMVMYDVAEEVRGESLTGIEADSYEDMTPYQILLAACRSAGYEPEIDDDERTISAVEN